MPESASVTFARIRSNRFRTDAYQKNAAAATPKTT